MRSAKISNIIFSLFFVLGFALAKQTYNSGSNTYSSLPIAYVPASFPVNFALYTSDKYQYVAFYDSVHQMTLAKRGLNEKRWEFQTLNSKVAWDSHNYLSIALDKKGIIHLAGNMHSSPLIYFRSIKPWDITIMQPVHKMTGMDEDIATYPEFMYNDKGEIIFHYRYGVSGSGYEVYNIWNSKEKKWQRLLDKPLTDGQGKMNAYMQGPLSGPDGFYHLLWVWRDTPDCATNHTLSYARSKDLVNWQSIRGEKINLPINFNEKELYVDTAPIHGGLINIGIKIGFDSDGNVLAGYHKYDEIGNTQLFVARFEKNNWKMYQVTNWDYRWDFKGYGTIRNDLVIEAPEPAKGSEEIKFGYHHIKYGDGQVILDNATLKPLRIEDFETTYPKEIDRLKSDNPKMRVNKVFNSGKNQLNKNFLLRWETLKPNRDQKPSEINLPKSILELIEY